MNPGSMFTGEHRTTIMTKKTHFKLELPEASSRRCRSASARREATMLLAETAATTPTTLAQKPSRAAGRSVSPAVSPPWEANDAPAGSDPEVGGTPVNRPACRSSEALPTSGSLPAGFRCPKPAEPTSCAASSQDSETTAKCWRELSRQQFLCLSC